MNKFVLMDYEFHLFASKCFSTGFELIVEFLTFGPDDGILQESVNGHMQLFALFAGGSAYLPFIVIPHFRSIAQVADTNRIEMTGYRFGPVGFALVIGAFKGALPDSFAVPDKIGTRSAIDEWRS